jgi:hypothetical protein
MSRPKLRKVDGAKRKKERKRSKQALELRTSLFLNIPEKCCLCETEFDKKSKEMAQTWHIIVYEDRKVMRLTCPNCREKVDNAMEKINAN